ncbi:transcriptional regulator ATRX homolog isoform X2 [Harmonia axyridis]|uniref:transcriptional regulator ATRX homolog isoform X2 n=1 Tax=Harmonia axyridis TaxID=115357 RepID=UPI001E276D1A|nr:transcriptional regulator ATRX homolog isoform X2 [Harmonia axyridis]
MPSNETNNEIIDWLVFLSSELKRKCESLSHSSDDEMLIKKNLSKLCEKSQNNLEAFRDYLRVGKKLTFSINLLNILGEERCKALTIDDIDKFEKELRNFINNYWLESNDPVYKNLSEIFNILSDKSDTVSVDNLSTTKDNLDSNGNKNVSENINPQNGLYVSLDQTLNGEANSSDKTNTGSHNNISKLPDEIQNSSENLHAPKEKEDDASDTHNPEVGQKEVNNPSEEHTTSIEINAENSQRASEQLNIENDGHFKEKSVSENTQEIFQEDQSDKQSKNNADEDHSNSAHTQEEKTSSEQVSTQGEKTPSEQVSTQGEKIPSEQVSTQGEKTPGDQVSTGEKITIEQVSTQGERTPSEQVCTQGEKTLSEQVGTQGDKTPSEQVGTPEEKTPSEQVSTQGEKILSEQVSTEGEKTPSEQVSTQGEKILSEQASTESEKTPSEQVGTQMEKIPSEQVSTEGEQNPSEQVGTQGEKTSSEQVSTQGEKIPSEQVSTEGENTPSEQVSTQESVMGPGIQEHSIISNDNSNMAKGEFLSFLGLNKISNYESFRNMRDELLMMISEEDCQNDNTHSEKLLEESDDSKEDSIMDEDSYDPTAVSAALKELDEDSFFETSSESEVDLSASEWETFLSDGDSGVNRKEKPMSNEPNTSISAFVPKKCNVNLVRDNLEKIQKELNGSEVSRRSSIEDLDDKNGSIGFELKDCSVRLEPLNASKENSELGTEDPANEDAIIDRLCRFPNFENNNKRKRDEEKEHKRKIKRKRRRSMELPGSETTDLSDYDSVSEDDIKKEVVLQYENDLPLDPNALLMEIVCHTIHDSDSDSSTIVSSEDENEENQQRKKVDNKTVPQREESETEKTKQNPLIDDPLLRCNLNLPLDKKQGNTNRAKRRRISLEQLTETSKRLKSKLRSKYLDPDCSDSYSSDDFEDRVKEKKDNKDQSKEDCDIEFVSCTMNKDIINIDSDDEEEDKQTTSRKKILPVLSTRELTERTRKAAEEEKERVARLEEQKHLRSSQESEASQVDSIILDSSPDGSKVVVDPNLSKKLFSHQIEGIKFMWDACYLSIGSMDTFDGTGCILAHNMGLGKTLQVVALVHTLFNHPATNTQHVLIVCPLSTVPGWKREFLNALNIVQTKKDIKITALESQYDPYTKCSLVIKWRKSKGVLILGYEAFTKLTKDNKLFDGVSMKEALVDPGPDLVVCDEGHLLKNGKALRTMALMDIRTKRRIALTGTPLQNNLNEYYYMVQFVKPNLLGNKLEFKRQFVNPIMNGQYEDSREHDITLMKKRTHVLNRLLKNTIQRYEATELHKHLEAMKDYVLFIQLHPVQEKLYRKYIEAIKKKDMEDGLKTYSSTFFVHYQLLKYICSHPQLLQTMESQKGNEHKEVISQEPEVHEAEGLPREWWKDDCPNEIVTNLEFGTKLQVMMGIIEEAEKIGEKVLIFTSSLVELSSVEYFLRLKGTPQCSCWKAKRDYFRMDGTISPSIRTEMCDMFNDENNKTLRVFLMSHKVGGLGLNLVAANRVILLGANFNPCLDTQSIYRAYRFGQKKPVYIYRLLSMGTMEEKMYHRCVTKLAIASRVVDKRQIARHYKNLDLEDLYNIEINLALQRTTPAKPDDDILSSILLKFDCVYKYHQHQKLLENRPDEELNEEDKKKAWEEFVGMNEKENGTVKTPTETKINEIIRSKWNQINMPPALKPISQLTNPAWKVNPISKEIPKTIDISKSNLIQTTLIQSGLTQPTVRVSTPIKSCRAPVNNNLLPPKMIPIKQKLLEASIQSKANCVRENVKTPMNSTPPVENKKNNPNTTLSTNKKQNNKGFVHKSSAIGPNPFIMKKGNLAKQIKRNWRWHSSEDFQSPSCSQWTHSSGSNNSKVPKVQQSRNSSVDDDCFIVIDESEESSQPSVASGRDEFKTQLDKLQYKELTITQRAPQKNQGNPTVIDITD